MQPLRDIRVLAVTVFLAGPYCSMNLARMGAEVIKIEIPGRGDPVRGNGPFAGPEGVNATRKTDDDLSTRFLKRNQGVKSITLNLRHPEGKEMFLKMAKKSDVVLENLAPGSLRRLGLGYEEVSAVNPGIVYCSISGYGQTGPYAEKPAHDPQIQAMSGLMDINGDPDRPPTRVGFYIGDLVTPLFACYSIVSALREKDRTGQGSYLDVSMMDSLSALMFMENLEEDMERGLTLRTGNVTRSGPTGIYKTRDGDISLTAASDEQWRKLSDALDAPDLLRDDRFKDFHSRTINVEAARGEIQARVQEYTRDAILKRFEEFDVPCGLVRLANEVVEDRHFWDRGTFQPIRHAKMQEAVPGVGSGFPVMFSGKQLDEMPGAPTLGMNNSDVYGDLLGLSSDDLTRLEREKVI